MTDIQDRKDIEHLVRGFYGRAREDELIGFFFSEVVNMDWEAHFPRMIDFWETILLDTPKFSGSVMDKHYAIDAKVKMEPKHFDQWLFLWTETVDALFQGEIANKAKDRAKVIALTMSFKMNPVTE